MFRGIIRGIIIISPGGHCLFHKSYGISTDNEFIQNNAHLVSSFIRANTSFSKEMIGKVLYTMDMVDETRFVFDTDDKNRILYVLLVDKSYPLFMLKQKLNHIKLKFKNYFLKLFHEKSANFNLIPDKKDVEEIIDPIILAPTSTGNVLDFINFFGVKKTAEIFSSLLSKQNIIVLGEDQTFIEKIILAIPLFLPFREFMISNEPLSVERVGLIIPWMNNFDILSSPNCWWIVGTANIENQSKMPITVVNINDKKIINGISPSYYENYLINSIKKLKDSQLAHLILSNKMQDLINIVRKLTAFNPIDEKVLKLYNLAPYFLPIIKKIIRFDFLLELEIREHFFTDTTSEMLGCVKKN